MHFRDPFLCADDSMGTSQPQNLGGGLFNGLETSSTQIPQDNVSSSTLNQGQNDSLFGGLLVGTNAQNVSINTGQSDLSDLFSATTISAPQISQTGGNDLLGNLQPGTPSCLYST